MRLYMVAAATALSLLTSSVFAAGDVAAGKVKAYTCKGCHFIHPIVKYQEAH